MSDPQDIPEDDALAAESVLRLLDPEAERAFETRLLFEPELRAKVLFWEAKLGALMDEIPEVVPPAAVKDRLLADIDGDDARPVRRWRLGGLAISSAIAISLAVFLALAPVLRGPSFVPALHATLISADGALHIEAGYAPDGMLFKIIHENGTPEPGRDFELWVIGETADTPVSLGIVPLGTEATFEISPEIADLIEDGTLAVSDEPAGGSPTGAPTGAILATGAFFDI